MCFDCRLDPRGGRKSGLRQRECGPSAAKMTVSAAGPCLVGHVGTLVDHQFDPSGDTYPLAWPGQAGRQFGLSIASSDHELSMIAVCGWGRGGRISTGAIRPWWQTGHALKEAPVSSS